MPLVSCTGGHRASKSSRGPKTVDYSALKRPEMPEITSFDDAARAMYRGSQAIEILSDLKTVDYNSQKCPKSRVLTVQLESCTGGHRASKFSQDEKTMDYSPRKRPEMPKITSFDDATGVVYRWSQGIGILPGPENRGLYSPRKLPEMSEITSFDDAARVVYRGSQCIEILP